MAWAFLGADSAVHRDGNRANNALDNLVATGGWGESVSMQKQTRLTAEEAVRIAAGESSPKVTIGMERQIRSGAKWASATEGFPRERVEDLRARERAARDQDIRTSNASAADLARKYSIHEDHVRRIRRAVKEK
jgi:hypothetical protein